MTNQMRWSEFAQTTVEKLIKPGVGEPLLVLADDKTNAELADACFRAAISSGADAQLLYFKSVAKGEPSTPGPIMSEAIINAKYILSLCGGTIRTPATLKARENGTRVLNTVVTGIEDYVIRALLDIDFEAMIRNGDLMSELWAKTTICKTTSPQGTDFTCEFTGRPVILGDGALTEDGEVDFYPGAQVSIAPIETSINGVVVVDASDGVQGIVNEPYAMHIENGVIVRFEGGEEARKMEEWMKSVNDSDIYRLCHYSVGLNPQAGISGNLIEDERKVGSLDLGFGYQDPKFEGTIGGSSPFHQDIMINSPTIFLDGVQMCADNVLNPDLGFEEV